MLNLRQFAGTNVIFSTDPEKTVEYIFAPFGTYTVAIPPTVELLKTLAR